MNLKYQYGYAVSLLKRYGIRGLYRKIRERRSSPMLSYAKHYRRYLPTEEELRRQMEEPLSYSPLISIVVPAYETKEAYLRALLESVLAQSYANWELCIADGSKTEAVASCVRAYAKKDARIRYLALAENGGISENTNSGFAMANGAYIALMDHDDVLAGNALYEMAACLNRSYTEEERAYAMVYSDEDKIDKDGAQHSRPHFKPDFNLEFLRHNNYFCHFLMFSAALLQKTGGLQKEYDGAQDYDFALRCVDAGAIVRHVPKILYHWRMHEGSTAGNSADKAYAFDNGCRAIEAHLKRRNEPGAASVTPNLGVYRVRYALRGDYAITVVAEEKEQLRRIRRHYQKEGAGDGAYRLNIHYMRIDSFQNAIEKACVGEYILYIRKQVKVRPKGLIETLLGTCQHAAVGVVGAKLLNEAGRVASCGVLYDGDGSLIGASGGLPAEYKGYFLHAAIPQNVSALSLDCAMFKRSAFADAGGMEEALDGWYRDADFCFRLAEQGYAAVVTPEATAVVRGRKREERAEDFSRERQKKLFLDRWEQKLAKPDPCYNCNLSLKPNHTYAMK